MAKTASRVCSRCGTDKLLGGRCAECRRAYSRSRLVQNREKQREKQRKFRDANPGYAKAWRDRNLDRERARERAYYQKNKDRETARQRAWKNKNRDRENTRVRERLRNASPEDRNKRSEAYLAWQKTPEGRASKSQAHRKRWETPSGRAYLLWKSAKYRASDRGLEFTLTSEFVRELMAKGCCQVTGIPFVFSRRPGRNNGRSGNRRPFAPSLDRKDPSQGYTPENVQLVVWIYNMAKSDWGHEDVMKMVEALSETERCGRFVAPAVASKESPERT